MHPRGIVGSSRSGFMSKPKCSQQVWCWQLMEPPDGNLEDEMYCKTVANASY